jgi:hypothetical protein
LIDVVRPGLDDVAECLAPHGAGLVRIDAEALQLGPGRRPAGAELDPAVADEVEDRHRLGGADRVVIGRRQQPHAVADPDATGARRDRAIEDLGIGAVGVLLEEVVLDRPKGMKADVVAEHRLLDHVFVRLVFLLLVPRPSHGNLIEQGELHAAIGRRG